MPQSVHTEHQVSITELFAAIGEAKESEAFRKEDNGKVERSEILYQTIGVPYERPEELSTREVVEGRGRFAEILRERGDEACAMRLVPTKPGLPKIRKRGLSIRDCYQNWLLKQPINPDDYRLFLCPHSETLNWSAIFVVNEQAIYGEIVRGLAVQLTQGDTVNTVSRFIYDYQNWQWQNPDPEAQAQIEAMLKLIHVPDPKKQAELRKKLDAKFIHDYLWGYFESTVWPDEKIYIIDYNRVLPKFFPVPVLGTSGPLSGVTAFPGHAQGTARVVASDQIASTKFSDGDILICDNTDVRFLPLMRKAGAIVTARGGILSHASIVARELKKPCVVGVSDLLEKIRNDTVIEVDADRGQIRVV